LENDNIKENQIKSEVDTAEVNTIEENTNVEIQKLINNEEKYETKSENSCAKFISANILDQVLLVAASSVLVLLCDVMLKLFGYMFVKGTGAIILAAGIIYFILNCIYAPIMGKSKAKNTIAKKILNIN
jgi:hypothetical protein